ncbi:MAG TPA: YciI family protein [Chitinophagaceae bacterium]|jgi:uncharacterized protein YciI
MNSEKKHFFIRLNPPRPDFATTMSEEERSIMQRHIAYWTPFLNDGTLIVFGPVMDPKGTFGMAVIAANNLEEANQLAFTDPATELGTIDIFPMRAATKQS